MDELTQRPTSGRSDDLSEPPIEPAAPDSASDVGMLGEPLRGDETSALAGAAPHMTVAPDEYEVPPSQRRFGEGVTSDSPNFQGRPNTSLAGGSDTTSAGGGSGL